MKLDNTNTFPVWLQDAGYRTGHVGKYLNQLPVGTIPPGYDDWQGINGSTRSYYNYTINDNGEYVSYGDTEQDYITDVLSQRTAETLRDMSSAGDPFYLSVGTSAPHVGANNAPPTPARRHEHLYDTATMPRTGSFNEAEIGDKPAYIRKRLLLSPTAIANIENRWRNEMESLRSVDDMVLNIVRTLNETGELDNTVIIFTSDNGFMHGEHRIPDDEPRTLPGSQSRCR